MKDAIRTLLSRILQLPEPLALDSLAALFVPRPQWLDATSEPPLDVQNYWAALFRLAGKISVRTRLIEYGNKQPNAISLDKLHEERDANRARIREMKHQMGSHFRSAKQSYSRLFEYHAANLRLNNPILVVENPPNTDGKITLLRDFFAQLTHQQQRLQLDEARLALFDQQNAQSVIVEHLRELDFDLSPDSDLRALIRQFDHQIAALRQVNVAFQNTLSELAQAMAQPDIQQQQEREQQIQLINQELSSLSAQLAEIDLDAHRQMSLMSEYRNPDLVDKQILLAQKRDAIPAAPYVSIPFWSSNPAESLEKKSLDWLTLFHQIETITGQRSDLEHQLASSTSSGDALLSDHSALYQHMCELLRSFDASISLDNLSLGGLAQCFVETQARLLAQIDQKEQLKTLLTQLQDSMQTTLALRTEHALLLDSGLSLVSNELSEELRSQSLVRRTDIQDIKEKLACCESTIKDLEELAQSEREYKKLERTRKSIRQQIKSANRLRLQDAATDYVETLDNEIMDIVHELRSLPPVQAEDEVVGAVPCVANAESVALDLIDADDDSVSGSVSHTPVASPLAHWHQRIAPLLTQTPQGFSTWYEDLYEALHAPEWMEIQSLAHQKEHVLRDIFFELQNPLPGGAFTTLRAWQTMCPEPRRDWRILTDLKLPISTDGLSWDESCLQPIRAQLQALYQQSARLLRNHPREGALLADLTRQLHKTSRLTDAHDKRLAAAILARGLVDPRYESLHHHRGSFPLREWLAKLFTSILSLFQAQTQNSYRQRFIFSPRALFAWWKRQRKHLLRYRPGHPGE